MNQEQTNALWRVVAVARKLGPAIVMGGREEIRRFTSELGEALRELDKTNCAHAKVYVAQDGEEFCDECEVHLPEKQAEHMTQTHDTNLCDTRKPAETPSKSEPSAVIVDHTQGLSKVMSIWDMDPIAEAIAAKSPLCSCREDYVCYQHCEHRATTQGRGNRISCLQCGAVWDAPKSPPEATATEKVDPNSCDHPSAMMTYPWNANATETVPTCNKCGHTWCW